MIALGAVCPQFDLRSDNDVLELTTSQISSSSDGKMRRFSVSKWPAKYFSGRHELEQRVRDFCSSKQRQNLLWEQDPNLRWGDRSSFNCVICWIQSDNERKIRQSFFRIARQLGILRDEVQEYDPELPSKVYHYLPKYISTLMIFDIFNPGPRSAEVGLKMVDYLPPPDLPNDCHPPVLIVSDAAEPLTGFLQLPALEMQEFIEKSLEMRFPGCVEFSERELDFLQTYAVVHLVFHHSPLEVNYADAFKTELFKALREFLDKQLQLRGELEGSPYSRVIISSGVPTSVYDYSGDTFAGNAASKKALSSDADKIHKFFQSRRNSEVLWDKTLIFSSGFAEKTVEEYVSSYGGTFAAVVVVDCDDIRTTKKAFYEICNAVGVAITEEEYRSVGPELKVMEEDLAFREEDYRAVSPQVATRVYEHFERNFQDNVLYVLRCSIALFQSPYGEIRSILEYLPASAHSGNHCPFTLICSQIYNAMITQPVSNSWTFRDDDLSQVDRDESEDEPSFSQMNGYPLAKALLNHKLHNIPEQKALRILRSEVRDVQIQFNHQVNDYEAETVFHRIAKETAGELTEAVVWMRLLNQLLSQNFGRLGFTFLHDVSHLSEIPDNEPHAQPGNSFAVNLRLNLVGPEFKRDVNQALCLLRKYSFIRYFPSDEANGGLTVVMHPLLRKLSRLAPCDSLQSQVNTTLLLLAQLGQVHLTVQQMLKLQLQMNSLATQGFDRLSKISLNSGTADPTFLQNLPEQRARIEEELSRLSSISGARSAKVMSITYGNVGIVTGGNVEAGNQVLAIVGSRNENVNNGVRDDGLSTTCRRRQRRQSSDGPQEGCKNNLVTERKYTSHEMLTIVLLTVVATFILSIFFMVWILSAIK